MGLGRIFVGLFNSGPIFFLRTSPVLLSIIVMVVHVSGEVLDKGTTISLQLPLIDGVADRLWFGQGFL